MICSKFINCLSRIFSFNPYFLFSTQKFKPSIEDSKNDVTTNYGHNKNKEIMPNFINQEEISIIPENVQLTTSKSDIYSEINFLLLQKSNNKSKFKELYCCSKYPRIDNSSDTSILFTKKSKSACLLPVHTIMLSTICKTNSEDLAVRQLCEKAITTCIQVRQMIDLYKDEQSEEFNNSLKNFKCLSLKLIDKGDSSNNLYVPDNIENDVCPFSKTSMTKENEIIIAQNPVLKMEAIIVERDAMLQKECLYFENVENCLCSPWILSTLEGKIMNNQNLEGTSSVEEKATLQNEFLHCSDNMENYYSGSPFCYLSRTKENEIIDIQNQGLQLEGTSVEKKISTLENECFYSDNSENCLYSPFCYISTTKENEIVIQNQSLLDGCSDNTENGLCSALTSSIKENEIIENQAFELERTSVEENAALHNEGLQCLDNNENFLCPPLITSTIKEDEMTNLQNSALELEGNAILENECPDNTEKNMGSLSIVSTTNENELINIQNQVLELGGTSVEEKNSTLQNESLNCSYTTENCLRSPLIINLTKNNKIINLQNQVPKLEETSVVKKLKNICLHCINSPDVPKNYSCPSCKKCLRLCTCIHCPHCKQSRIRFHKELSYKYKPEYLDFAGNVGKLSIASSSKSFTKNKLNLYELSMPKSVNRFQKKNLPKEASSKLGKMLKNNTSQSVTSSLKLPWNSSSKILESSPNKNLNNTFKRMKCDDSGCNKKKEPPTDIADVFRTSEQSEIEEREEYFGECYKNKDYHRMDTYTYYTVIDFIQQYALPQPSSKKK